jgi:retinol dehydrogenase 12
MKDKIVLVTGATSGIGKVAALELAKMGAHVVIHGRNSAKAENVKNEIISQCRHANIDTLIGDVSSLADITRMAEEFNSKYNRLDVLLNNAGGVMDAKRQVTVDGLERTFAVNVASLFLLTNLLFDKIRLSDEGRIVNVSSMAHKFGRPDMNDLQCEKKYSSNLAYGNAKLFVIYFTEELDRRMKASGITNITANALHPGVVRTNFAKESKGSGMNFFFTIFGKFLISPEKGAATSIYLASSPDVKEVSGKYFAKCRETKVRRTYNSEQNKKLLWEACETITGAKFL